MCNWYEYDLAEWEVRELVEHYQLSGHNLREPAEVFPNGPGMVVVDRDNGRTLERMLWGLTPWIDGKWLINFHNPESEPWKSLIENRAQRCVVPATSFAASGHGTGNLARWRWFAQPSRKPFMFAGVWTRWYGDRDTNDVPNVGEHQLYSIMTTEANATVQPIDDVMPVILTTAAEVEQWLAGSVEEALLRQKPVADDVVKLLADEKKAA